MSMQPPTGGASQLAALTDTLIPPPGPGSAGVSTVQRQWGRVTAVAAIPPSVTVSIADAGTATPGVRYSVGYTPQVGDLVLVDLNGGDPFVVGTRADDTTVGNYNNQLDAEIDARVWADPRWHYYANVWLSSGGGLGPGSWVNGGGWMATIDPSGMFNGGAIVAPVTARYSFFARAAFSGAVTGSNYSQAYSVYITIAGACVAHTMIDWQHGDDNVVLECAGEKNIGAGDGMQWYVESNNNFTIYTGSFHGAPTEASMRWVAPN